MRLIDINHIKLAFSPECECDNLGRIEVDPVDALEIGMPMCPDCETEYYLESWAELTGPVRER